MRWSLLVLVSIVTVTTGDRWALADTIEGPVCWAPPAKAMRRSQQAQLAEIMNQAARATQPERSLRPVTALGSAKDTKFAALECAAVVTTTLEVKRRAWTLTLLLTKGTETASAAVALDARALSSAALEPTWRRFWRVVDPPPPPAPPPPPVATAPPPPEIDPDLAREIALSAPRPVAETPPRVRLRVSTALSMRTASSNVGPALDHGPLLGFGGDATLLVGSWWGPRHALDLRAGYFRRLAKVVIGEVDAAADADRFDVAASYRYALVEDGLSIGPQVGWQFLRFEVDPRAGALSTRYGVLRLGGEARLPLGSTLELAVQGAVRVAPDGGVDPGFDLAGGPELLLGRHMMLRAWVGYTQQSGEGFRDRQVDLELAVGARL